MRFTPSVLCSLPSSTGYLSCARSVLFQLSENGPCANGSPRFDVATKCSRPCHCVCCYSLTDKLHPLLVCSTYHSDTTDHRLRFASSTRSPHLALQQLVHSGLLYPVRGLLAERSAGAFDEQTPTRISARLFTLPYDCPHRLNTLVLHLFQRST